jgi:tRNA G18 (ribose-2'-O)-methylase SpoU
MERLHLIVHDIRSAQNVGSLLRTCDSLGVETCWVTGYSPRPDHPRVAKTALGAEKSVAVEVVTDILDAIARLRADGFCIVGLELDPRAVCLQDYRPDADRIALLLGNEVDGIPPSLRALCDDLVAIDQHGIKESLNVSVAAGIALWAIAHR